MRAYYFDNLPGDQRLPHDCVPSRPVSEDTVRRLGVMFWSIPVDGHEPKLDAVAAEREYKNKDFIDVTKEGLGDAYEQMLEKFFQEHLHEDEEIRYILSGTGYFDIREMPSDEWIRLAAEPGDLLVLPAGIYHRFTLDTSNAISAKRLFKDEPKWTAYPRGPDTDASPQRVAYLTSIGLGA